MSNLANLATDLAKACRCASEPCVAMLRGHGGHCCLTAEWEPNGVPRHGPKWERYPGLYSPPARAIEREARR